MDPVHDRGSMDSIQSGGPWTPGPCFVLTHQLSGTRAVVTIAREHRRISGLLSARKTVTTQGLHLYIFLSP